MRNGPRSTETTPSLTTYVLPLDAYVALVHTRDELHLLSGLAEPRNDDDRDEIVVSTQSLADCFSRIAEQLDDVLQDTQRLE